ncbi:hypothetical protein AB835_07850 [Candidatus Endobugula sertula]|uniref:Uncharacterized protein n=1 Tax=Candidatus Endobugula sertula TaxID=62101 RepID=A0A1D2QPU6_9GAMM|nr:hypothetical protein AB835_07850 [Candidatus Endobugula sertula]
MMKEKILFALLLIIFSGYSFALPAMLEQELEFHIKEFQQGTPSSQQLVARQLESAGFSDTRLFDLIEKKLLVSYADYIENSTVYIDYPGGSEDYVTHGGNKYLQSSSLYTIDYLSWLAKALAFSGQEKYQATFKKMLAQKNLDEKLKKYIEISIKLLPKYTNWNKVILNGEQWDDNWPNNINRFALMIQSGDLHLEKLAKKNAAYHESNYSNQLLGLAEYQLLKRYKSHQNNNLSVSNTKRVNEASDVLTSIEQELKSYIAIFQTGSNSEKKTMIKRLEWSGLEDPRLFDLIEQQLLENYLSKGNKEDIDYLSWLAKALAFSGQDKYRTTLLKVANNNKTSRKLRKYAKLSISTLKDYKRWNTVIFNEKQWNNNWPIDINRLFSMVQSNDFHLKRLAAKHIHHKYIYHTELLDSLEQQLLKHYQSSRNDHLFVNALIGMSKALAGSQYPQYKETIGYLAKSAKNKKLRAYARKDLKFYYYQRLYNGEGQLIF